MIVAASAVVVLLAALLGGSVASFLCLVVERRQRGERITGRSHCACGRKLTAGENVPVVGWLRTRGTARCCGARVSRRYLFWESVFAAMYAVSSAAAVYHVALNDGDAAAALVTGTAAAVYGAVVLVLLEARAGHKDRNDDVE